MSYFKNVLIVMFSILLGLSLYGCFGGGGGGEEQTSTSPSSTTVTASLTALVDTNTSQNVRVLRAEESTSLGKATLIVDTNRDGEFTSSDEKYESVIDAEGKVNFKNISLPGEGTYQAKLRIEKNGRAPYEKIVEISKDASLTVKVTTTPVQKVTKEVAQEITLAKRGVPVYLVFALKKGSAGVKRIEIRTSSRRNVRVDPDTELQAVIPGNILPDNISTITASMERFSGVTDREYFPGRFIGEGAPSRYIKRDGSNTYRLKSVAFSLIRLEDQNGNPVQFESKRDENNTIEVDISIPQDALSQITEDADINTPGVQVPIYRYRYETGDWEYIGTGDLYKNGELYNGTLPPDDVYSDYKVKIEVPAYQWSEYLNIDYPVWFGGEPVIKNVCIQIKNENGTPLTWVDVWADGPSYFYDWTNENGIVKFEIPVANNGTDFLTQIKNSYDFYYNYWAYGLYNIKIDENFTTQNLPSGCDYITAITIQNPFNAKVEIHVKDTSGTPLSGKWVEIWSSDYYYYNWGQTDKDGVISFKVKSGVKYYLNVAGDEKTVNVNGLIDEPGEISDNGYIAIVEVTKENQPPQVDVWVYPDPVKQNATTTATISAWDPDGDNISLKSITFEGKDIKNNCVGDTYNGWGYWTCTLNISNITSNSAVINATVSDGKKEASASYLVSIITGTSNQPPEIYGVIILNSNGTEVWDWNRMKIGNYTIEAYGWDPDGDEIQFSYYINGTQCNNTCELASKGEYELKVVATDTQGASNYVIYKLKVIGNDIPAEIQGFWTDKIQVQSGDSITVYAFVYDPDTKLKQDNFKIFINNSIIQTSDVSLEDWGEGYYYYTAIITVPSDIQNNNVELKIDVNNATAVTTLWLSIPNSPPVFTQELPDTLTLNKGDSHTFEVSAYDPDGNSVTYEWYVKYGTTDIFKNQNASGTSFTYTFENAGTYWIKCLAKDSDGNTAETISIVNVNAPEITGKVILHLGIGGVYVSRYDPDNGFSLIETKQTDDTGTVEFDNVNGYAWLSFAFTPDMYLAGIMLEEAKNEIFNEIASQIQKDYNLSELPTCLNSTTLQEFVQYSPPPVSYSGNLTELINQSDLDGNGCLDKDEFWNIIVTLADTNGDGKLSIKEFNQFDNTTNIYVAILIGNIPEGEYFINSPLNEHAFENWQKVDVMIKNVPPGLNVNIFGSSWSQTSVTNYNTVTADLSTTLYTSPQPEDAKYSLIFLDSYNKKFYYLFDLTQNAVVVDYNDFLNLSPISILNYNQTLIDVLNLYGIHSQTLYKVTNWDLISNNTIWAANIPDFDYYILETEKENYYPIDTLNLVRVKFDEFPTTIDLNNPDFSYLNVTVLEVDNNTYQLNGTDANLINEWNYDYYLNTNDYFNYYDLEVSVFHIGSVENALITIPDWYNLIPEEAKQYVDQIETVAQSTTAFEDKKLRIAYYPGYSTVKDLFNMHITTSQDEIIPVKEMEIYLNSEKRSNRRKKENEFTLFPSIKINLKRFLSHIFNLNKN